MHRKNKKKLIAIRCVLSSRKSTKTRFRPGLCPRPRWGTLRRSRKPPSRLGRGHPLPIALSSVKSSAYAYVVRKEGARVIFLQGQKFEVTPLIILFLIRTILGCVKN